MKTTLTNAEAARCLETLNSLRKLDTSLPVAAGYKMVQTVRTLAAALLPYDEMREKIIRKYAKDGKSVKREDDPAAFEKCVAELEELDGLTVDVEIYKFPVSLIEGRDLPLKTIFALDFMLE